ncbi:hypothetical protein [Nocardioides sp.]|uniref:hypothetical protein n=1 Tax=Nocardioides sp. TaxID=35761 RepID=UPI00271CAEB2|nr:hypothetical protein [Nocardioides sp.]MDO9455468.1 hypothetical protein [Nocardioides sp.]
MTSLQITARVLVGFHALAAGATLFLFLALGASFVGDDPDGLLLLAGYAAGGLVYLVLCLVAVAARRRGLRHGFSVAVAVATLVGARAIGGPGAELPSDVPELLPTFALLVLAVTGLVLERDRARAVQPA